MRPPQPAGPGLPLEAPSTLSLRNSMEGGNHLRKSFLSPNEGIGDVKLNNDRNIIRGSKRTMF